MVSRGQSVGNQDQPSADPNWQWVSQSVPRLFRPQGLKWEWRRGSSEAETSLSVGAMAGREVQRQLSRRPDFRDQGRFSFWPKAHLLCLHSPIEWAKRTSCPLGNPILAHRNVVLSNNPDKASQDNHTRRKSTPFPQTQWFSLFQLRFYAYFQLQTLNLNNRILNEAMVTGSLEVSSPILQQKRHKGYQSHGWEAFFLWWHVHVGLGKERFERVLY